MKFLCRNCKAKYQIADEKVLGRTLRMTCQQCGEPIVVRGNTGAERVRTAGARPLEPLTLSGPSASSLGAEFQRQLSAPAPAAREPLAARGEWHIAINDVPVGPMRREEVARKIASSAVDRESLAWREGLDDWLPIKHIPELVALFAALAPPPPVGPALGVAAVPAAPPPPAAGLVAAGARAPQLPVGSSQLGTAGDDHSAPRPEPVAVRASEAPAAAGGKPLGWGPMFALVSGGAFILAAGVFLGVRVLAPQPSAAPVVSAPAPQPPPAATPHEQPVAADDTQPNVIELDVQPINGQQNSGSGRRPTGSSGIGNGNGSSPAAKKDKQLTSEQKDLLARMGGGLDQAGPNLRAETERDRPSGGQTGQLTAQQLSAVVLRGRKNLQRCYETALRGSGSGDTVRLDVEIEVSPNGNVTLVRANGKGLPGMDECITRTVKMWRFPSSAEATQTRFPVVFQPGA